jgi:hypothetical protein
MDDIEKFVSPELRTAVQRFGFDKVAAKMYGVEEINEKTASEIIGTKLMTRLAEWRTVSTGLRALRSLEKTSFAGFDDAIGAAVGYSYGKKQKDRGEEHSFGAKQVGSLLLPGGLGYQAGRGLAHSVDHKKKDDDKKEHSKKEHSKKDKE